MRPRAAPCLPVWPLLALGILVGSDASAVGPDAPSPSTPTPTAVTPTPNPGKAEYVGAKTCLGCHASLAAYKDSRHARAMAQVKGIEFSKTCETCHGPGSLHAAAAGDKSNPGYGTIRDLKSLSAIDLNKTCLECHQGGAQMYWVGSKHESRNVSCAACHSMHEPKSDKHALKAPTEDQVCAQCHKDVVARVHRTAHMPILEGKMSCSSCHNPHGSATPKMIQQESANAACLGCHADKRGPFLWEHPPVRENCMNCHDPHGTHNEKMLAARQPFLCQRCHIASGHPATPYDQTTIDAAGTRVAGSCVNCHPNIHGSNHPSGQQFMR
jgi:DmsE family decaheme c-type cytochrome